MARSYQHPHNISHDQPSNKEPTHIRIGNNTIVSRTPTHSSFLELILALYCNYFQKITGEARAISTPRITCKMRLSGMASNQIINIINSIKVG